MQMTRYNFPNPQREGPVGRLVTRSDGLNIYISFPKLIILVIAAPCLPLAIPNHVHLLALLAVIAHLAHSLQAMFIHAATTASSIRCVQMMTLLVCLAGSGPQSTSSFAI